MKRMIFCLSVIILFSVITSGCSSSGNQTPIEIIQVQATPKELFSIFPTPTTMHTAVSTQISPRDGMPMVYVPAGDFSMGGPIIDEYSTNFPLHTVTLDAFWIDQTEVTNAMFAAFIYSTGILTTAEKEGMAAGIPDSDGPTLVYGANWQHPFGPDSNLVGLENHPVVDVNWYEAQAYCQWAGRRLPTEAEWEKAARGIDGYTYPWGNASPAGNLVNFADRNANKPWADLSVDDGYMFSSPVGFYPEGMSPYGALDMAGNVCEWVADWHADYQPGSNVNPLGPSTGETRVARGGSYLDGLWLISSDSRFSMPPRIMGPFLGFRCAQSDQQPVATDLPAALPVPTEERAHAAQTFASGMVVHLFAPQPETVRLVDLDATQFSVRYILSRTTTSPGDNIMPGIMITNAAGDNELQISYISAIEDWVSESGEIPITLSSQSTLVPVEVTIALFGTENNEFVVVSNTITIPILP